MSNNLYVIYDKVADECSSPFMAVNDGIAIRKFKSMNIPSLIRHEYSLIRVGSIDTKTCELIPEVHYHLNIEEI